MMRPWLTRARWAWRALRRPDQLDAAMHEEMRFHIAMEAERLVREHGLDDARGPAASARRVRRSREVQGRGARHARSLAGSTRSRSMRARLRMLVKHRWLTLVGGFAMAVAIAVGATFFEVVTEVLNPALPLEEGDRIVAVAVHRRLKPEIPSAECCTTSSPGATSSLRSSSWGHFAPLKHNLVSGMPAALSRSRLPRSRPRDSRWHVHRRCSADTCFRPTIAKARAPVLVIGYQVWQSHFGGDPHIVGKAINLDWCSAHRGRRHAGAVSSFRSIISSGFRSAPIRPSNERLQGPALHVFGRLAPGVTLGGAGRADAPRASAPPRHIPKRIGGCSRSSFRTRVRISTSPIRESCGRYGSPSCSSARSRSSSPVNLAILMYARTVTRLGEIAVRTALGASSSPHPRAAVHRGACAVGRRRGRRVCCWRSSRSDAFSLLIPANGSVPFWLDFNLSPRHRDVRRRTGGACRLCHGCAPGPPVRPAIAFMQPCASCRAARAHVSDRCGPRSSSHRSQWPWLFCRRPFSWHGRSYEWRSRAQDSMPRGSWSAWLAVNDGTSVVDANQTSCTATRIDRSPASRAGCVRRYILIEYSRDLPATGGSNLKTVRRREKSATLEVSSLHVGVEHAWHLRRAHPRGAFFQSE